MMHGQMTVNRFKELRGRPVYDSTGKRIGKVEEVFWDVQTQVPEWLGIGTGIFGRKRVLVPVGGSREQADGVQVAYSGEKVKDSPEIESDEISIQTERELAGYYGLGYSQSPDVSTTGLTEGTPMHAEHAADVPAEPEPAERRMTRTEEELQVGKRTVETGRARLRKWVETEPVETEVALQQETAYITRERIDQPVSEHEFKEEEVEVELRGEEPVVRKQTVAKERVGIGKEVRTERETVQEELRKEHIEVEGAGIDEERR